MVIYLCKKENFNENLILYIFKINDTIPLFLQSVDQLLYQNHI